MKTRYGMTKRKGGTHMAMKTKGSGDFDGLNGLGYTSEQHDRLARAWTSQMVAPTLSDVLNSLDQGDCEAAFSDMLRLAEHATGVATHAVASERPDADAVINAVHRMEAQGAEAFARKCLRKRRR